MQLCEVAEPPLKRGRGRQKGWRKDKKKTEETK